jgi:hypothetical protein
VSIKARILLALATLVAVSAPVWADRWADPGPRVFGSQQGTRGFKVLHPKFAGPTDPDEGVLFRLDAEGKEQIVWRSKLVNRPGRVLVAEKGDILN